MSVGLIIGLLFLTICIIVRLSGVLDDDTQEQNKVELKPTKRLDAISSELTEIHKEVKSLSKKVHKEKELANKDTNSVMNEFSTSNLKKIIYYKTDKELERIIEKFGEAAEYVDAHDVDEDIASYIAVIVGFNYIKDFHEYDKSIEDYRIIRGRLLRVENLEKRVQKGISLFIRSNKHEYEQKYLNNAFCSSVISDMHNEINDTHYLLSILRRFAGYWNGVIGGYVRKHAYVNRLQYLIDYTESLKSKSYIKDNHAVLNEISQIQARYITLHKSAQ